MKFEELDYGTVICDMHDQPDFEHIFGEPVEVKDHVRIPMVGGAAAIQQLLEKHVKSRRDELERTTGIPAAPFHYVNKLLVSLNSVPQDYKGEQVRACAYSYDDRVFGIILLGRKAEEES